MRRDTRFRIASITKPATAVAAMILVKESGLHRHDSIEPWLPELANRRVLKSLAGPLDDAVAAHRAQPPPVFTDFGTGSTRHSF